MKNQEAEIVHKRRELLDLEEYLFLFDNLEKIFIENDPQEILKPLFDSEQGFTSEQLERFITSLRTQNQTEFIRTKSQHSQIHKTLQVPRNSTRKLSFVSNEANRSDKKVRTSLCQQKNMNDEEDEKDRLIIRGKLEFFYQKHQNGPEQLIQKLVKILREMKFFSSSLQNQYEDLIKLKNQKNNNLDFLTRNLEEILQKNPKALETTESKLFLLEEEEGCGIVSDGHLTIPAIQIKPNSNITTVNVIKNYVNSRTKSEDLKMDNKKLISFSMKIYLFLIFVAQRLCKLVKLIGDISKEIPLILIENTQSTLKKIDFNFHTPLTSPGKELDKKMSISQAQNVFNFFPESAEKSETMWHLSTPKPLKLLNHLAERNENELIQEVNNLKFLDKNNGPKKILIDIFDNIPMELLDSLNEKIKDV